MSDRLTRNLRNVMNFNLAPLWGSMTRNWIIKSTCVLLAFMVWQGIRESTSFEVVVTDIPVKIYTGDGHAVLEQSTDVVSVRFRGSRDDIRFISREQVSIEMDLTERSDSLRHEIKLSPRYVRAPSQAHAVHFMPDDIVITLDREVERVLPVKATFAGQLPEEIKLDRAVCEPASIRIRGAEQRLLDLEQVRTLPIRLDGRYNSFGTHVPIAVEDQPWTASPERVMVNVELVEQSASRVIEQVAVRSMLASGGAQTVTVVPDRVRLVLRGSSQRIETLDAGDVFVYADCSELTEPTDYEVQVHVDAPRGIQVDQVIPSVVQVSVKTM
jgi:YbbR domain-containing protein